MAERAGYDNAAVYSISIGGNHAICEGETYQPTGVTYPSQGSSYLQSGEAYPQGGYGQEAVSQQSTTAVIVNQPVLGPRASHFINYSPPKNYMCWSIIACLFCFWPSGLIAIYYAWKTNKMREIGDMKSAKEMSDLAYCFIVASVTIGIVWIIVVIVSHA